MNNQEAFTIALEEAKISFNEGGVPVCLFSAILLDSVYNDFYLIRSEQHSYLPTGSSSVGVIMNGRYSSSSSFIGFPANDLHDPYLVCKRVLPFFMYVTQVFLFNLEKMAS